MLRRVARLVRASLFLLGVLCVAYLPLSHFFAVVAATPRFALVVIDGGLAIQLSWGMVPAAFVLEGEFGIRPAPEPGDGLLWAIIKTSTHFRTGSVTGEDFTVAVYRIPLWLLAFLCLAWPVTSFILARRRHKRGFPVEPKATQAASSDAPKG